MRKPEFTANNIIMRINWITDLKYLSCCIIALPILLAFRPVMPPGAEESAIEISLHADCSDGLSIEVAGHLKPDGIRSQNISEYRERESMDSLPKWALGPFARPINPEPAIKPNPESTFYCPMRKKDVPWESRHTFNPAAVVKDGKIYVLYRAEDNSSKGGIGSFTSRIGLAVSDDGIHFKTGPEPVFFPEEDAQKDWEWYGGCEDPRISGSPDGTYIMTYTRYSRGGTGITRPRLGIATSRDLINWTKHGSPLTNPAYAEVESKSASIVNEIKDGNLVATRINGKYWMYYGVQHVFLATSDDLIHWTTIEESKGKRLAVLKPRSGYFDSKLNEVGPQVLLTQDGIVLLYNGMNEEKKRASDADPSLPFRIYTCGQALFDASDPAKLLARLDKPFFKPELEWEKSGQYIDGTTFIEGLALFKGKWFLYYGCADTYVGVAMADVTKR